jgi:N-acetylglucosamine kinase-like BadF-type ATPase
MSSFYLGIEGGGTKSTFCYFDAANNDLISQNGPALQARNNSIPELVTLISDTVALQRAQTQIHLSGITCAIAGAGSSSIKHQLQEALSNVFAVSVLVMSDAEGTWNCGFSKADQAILSINGTGSAILFPKNEQLIVAGGLGSSVSELMSGRSLSNRAFEFMYSEIITRNYSSLTKRFIDEYDLHSRSDILNHIYSSEHRLSDLTLLIAEEAEKGCPLSQEIIRQEKESLLFNLKLLKPVLDCCNQIAFHGGLHNNSYLSKEIHAAFKQVLGNIEIKKLPPIAETLAKRGLNADFISF